MRRSGVGDSSVAAAERTAFYTGHMIEQLGAVVTILGFAGIGTVLLRQGATGRSADSWLVAALSAMVLATLIFLAFRVARGMEETVNPERSSSCHWSRHRVSSAEWPSLR